MLRTRKEDAYEDVATEDDYKEVDAEDNRAVYVQQSNLRVDAEGDGHGRCTCPKFVSPRLKGRITHVRQLNSLLSMEHRRRRLLSLLQDAKS